MELNVGLTFPCCAPILLVGLGVDQEDHRYRHPLSGSGVWRPAHYTWLPLKRQCPPAPHQELEKDLLHPPAFHPSLNASQPQTFAPPPSHPLALPAWYNQSSPTHPGERMPQFQFTVLETVVQEKIYTVEAETEEQARAKAEEGDTLSEEFVKTEGVSERDIFEYLGPKA